MRLLVVSGSPPDSSRSFSAVRRSAAQPPGPGLPRQAPSVKISIRGSSVTSGDKLSRKLENNSFRRVIGDFLVKDEAFGKSVDDFPDEQLGRRCSGGNSDSVW